MAKQLNIRLKITTTADWTQVDVLDKWVKVAQVGPPVDLSDEQALVIQSEPFHQYLPGIPGRELISEAWFCQGAASIIRLEKPAGAKSATATVPLTLELPDSIGLYPLSGVKNLRFGVARAGNGRTQITFGLDSQPAFENDPAGDEQTWPHLIYEIPISELWVKALNEMSDWSRSGEPLPQTWYNLRRNRATRPEEESAELLERSRTQPHRHPNEAIWEEIFAQKLPY